MNTIGMRLPLGLALSLFLAGCGGQQSEVSTPEIVATPAVKDVLHSTLAGRWYPADREELAAAIAGYLSRVEQDPVENIHALILPHAGYRYSGQTAAYGLDLIAQQQYRRIVVLGPTHRVPMHNVASIPDQTHYATPLGEVPLDTPFIEALRKHDCFQHIPQAHDGEHSVQIEVPLLQQTLGDFKLVPIVVGRLDRDVARRMGKILLGEMDAETLVVVSSDFTHHGPNFRYTPFQDNLEENIRTLDLSALAPIQEKDVDAFYDFLDQTQDTICGRYPIAVLLSMLSAEDQVKMIKYETSGRLTGDFSNSVSYFTIAFSGRWSLAKKVEATGEGTVLDQADKRELLRLARSTIAYIQEHRRMPEPKQLETTLTPAMKQIAGSFVTLSRNERLRGCIGDIVPTRPLYESVMANAYNAAYSDHRFRPLASNELEHVDVEISVLTPPKAVASYKDIEIGKHGMILSKAGRRAVYLPQVAPEQHWDLAETLTHLSQKAGLSTNAWKEGASFQVFEAIVFAEDHL